MTPCYPLQEGRQKRRPLDVGRLAPLRSEQMAVELALALALPVRIALGEVTVIVPAERIAEVLLRLRTAHGFEQVVNFAVSAGSTAPADDIVIHLLSISRNLRLRVKTKVLRPPRRGGISRSRQAAPGLQGRP